MHTSMTWWFYASYLFWFYSVSLIFQIFSNHMSNEKPRNLPNSKLKKESKDLVQLLVTVRGVVLVNIVSCGFWSTKDLPSRKLTEPGIPTQVYLKMIFLFPRWDMLVSWRLKRLCFDSLTNPGKHRGGRVDWDFFLCPIHEKQWVSDAQESSAALLRHRYIMLARPTICTGATGTTYYTSA